MPSSGKWHRISQSAVALASTAMVVLPVILLVVFGLIWLTDRLRGGYKPEKI